VLGSSFRDGFAIELIAWMIEQIPQLDGESGARACSAWVGYSLYLANIPEITCKNLKLVSFLSDRVKYSG
jgi:hypothetical protein